MAGSKTWRAYTSDNGTVYSIQIDESNARAFRTGTSTAILMPARTTNAPIAPAGLKKRYVNTFNEALPTQKRKFYVGTAATAALLLQPGATITGEDYPESGDVAGTQSVWVVTSYRGEGNNVAPSFEGVDTGLTDDTVGQ
jgi:hypothetical protein